MSTKTRPTVPREAVVFTEEIAPRVRRITITVTTRELAASTVSPPLVTPVEETGYSPGSTYLASETGTARLSPGLS